jgi:hypothetical protein
VWCRKLARTSCHINGLRDLHDNSGLRSPVAIDLCTVWATANAVAHVAESVAVVVWLVRAVLRHSDVLGLCVGELRQGDANSVDVQACDLLIEIFR